MPKATQKEDSLTTPAEALDELQLPAEFELDNVWNEVLFRDLEDFLPVDFESEDGESSALSGSARGDIAKRIRKEYESEDPEAVRIVKAHERKLLLQLKLAGAESKKEAAKRDNETNLRPSFERVQSQLRKSAEWKKFNDEFLESLFSWAEARGLKDVGTPAPQSKLSTAISATLFSFHTSQEMSALHYAQADGKTGKGYERNEQAGAIVHQRAGLSHLIRMELTVEERTAGLALSYLEELARSQDADAVLATSYVLGVLAPPPHLPARPYAGGWIDFDDVIKKIGWIPRNTKDRREMHAKIWRFVKFGERAQIIGRRTGNYKIDGQEIDTNVQGAAWRVMKTEKPDPSKLSDGLEIPVRAEIVVSKELTALISHPKIAQYFQCGEVLGAIPNGKPAGAWARVIGLSLMSFWRRKPHEHNAGTLKPTRRELLDNLPAKIAPYEEILESNDPSRAIDYWCSAIQILADEGFIERGGEAEITSTEMKSGLPRKNWQDLWLNQSVSIEPGTETKSVFEKILSLSPPPKRRDLKKKPRAKKRPQ